MNNTLKTYIAFFIGAGIGSGITWYLTKAHYMKFADNEIEQIREFYKNRSKKEEMSQANQNKKDISEYKKTIEDRGYRDYSTQKDVPVKTEEGSKTESVETEEDPPVTSKKDMVEPNMEIKGISQEEFERIDEYEQNYLVYYADGTLADAKTNEIIPTPSSEVGYLFENEFGIYEPDVAYICNYTMGTKYEIQKTGDVYESDDVEGTYAEDDEDF